MIAHTANLPLACLRAYVSKWKIKFGWHVHRCTAAEYICANLSIVEASFSFLVPTYSQSTYSGFSLHHDRQLREQQLNQPIDQTIFVQLMSMCVRTRAQRRHLMQTFATNRWQRKMWLHFSMHVSHGLQTQTQKILDRLWRHIPIRSPAQHRHRLKTEVQRITNRLNNAHWRNGICCGAGQRVIHRSTRIQTYSAVAADTCVRVTRTIEHSGSDFWADYDRISACAHASSEISYALIESNAPNASSVNQNNVHSDAFFPRRPIPIACN